MAKPTYGIPWSREKMLTMNVVDILGRKVHFKNANTKRWCTAHITSISHWRATILPVGKDEKHVTALWRVLYS